jgi:hypothetical protein
MNKTKKKSKWGWGGARPGAGRPKDPNSGAPHTPRPKVKRSDRVLLSYELSDTHPIALSSVNRAGVKPVVGRAIEAASGRFGFKVAGWAITGERLTVRGSGASTENLSRAAQGLGVRVARSVNGHLGTSGKLFADRYRLVVIG